jgi:hypothetical protein
MEDLQTTQSFPVMCRFISKQSRRMTANVRNVEADILSRYIVSVEVESERAYNALTTNKN